MLLGFLLGNLTSRSPPSQQPAQHALQELDYNRDGVPDVHAFYSNDGQSYVRYDRDFDGRPDYDQWYSNDIPLRAEADDNCDGKVDYWVDYRNGYPAAARADTDFNGIPDNIQTFRNGMLERVEWYPNGQASLLYTELFEHGIKRKEIRPLGTAKNGVHSVEFDAFGTRSQNDKTGE